MIRQSAVNTPMTLLTGCVYRFKSGLSSHIIVRWCNGSIIGPDPIGSGSNPDRTALLPCSTNGSATEFDSVNPCSNQGGATFFSTPTKETPQ